ncbi:hypothetical protein LINPERHAP2_LOCUS24598 [Linum perenne]
MERAWQGGFRHIEVQIDSLCAVKLLSQTDGLNHQHIYREGNHLADYLAGKGHLLGMGRHTVDITDRDLQYWARYDEVVSIERRLITTM